MIKTALNFTVNVSEKKIEQIIQSVRHQFKDDVVQAIEDNSRIVTDLLRQEIKATENRLVKRMDDLRDDLRGEIAQTKEEIIEVIDSAVLPQIDWLDRRVTRLERLA